MDEVKQPSVGNPDEWKISLEDNSASLKISRDIYVRILSRAIEQTKQDINDLEAAVPVNDVNKIQSISHRLKGDYDNMRLPQMSVLAKQINDMSKTEPDKEKVAELIGIFKQYFDRLRHILDQQAAG